MNSDNISGDKQGDSLSEALSAYRNLTSRFNSGSRGTSGVSEVGVELPLSEVVKLIPEQYRDESHSARASDTVFISIPDLLEQLRKGKVTVGMHELVACIPAAMVFPQAFDDQTSVNIPLALVVNAMDRALLERRVDNEQLEKEYDIGDIPDPFKRGELAPREEIPIPSRAESQAPQAPTHEPPIARVEASPPPSKPMPAFVEPSQPIISEPRRPVEPFKPVEKPVVIEAPPMPPPELAAKEMPPEPAKIEVHPPLPIEASAEPPPAPVSEEPAREVPVRAVAVEAPELPVIEEIGPPGGVNLNSCDVQQLSSFEGVSATVAQRILEYRAAHGAFDDIFALCDVPGVGKNTFKLVTGMPYSAKRRHRALKLAKLLGMSPSRICHIPTVSQAVGKLPGFCACIISDKDGLVVAASEAGPLAEAIGPVAHEIRSQIRRSMEMAGARDVDTVSISQQGQMFTIVRCVDFYLTIMHHSNRITGATLNLIRTVADELTWALSRRVYVGPRPL